MPPGMKLHRAPARVPQRSTDTIRESDTFSKHAFISYFSASFQKEVVKNSVSAKAASWMQPGASLPWAARARVRHCSDSARLNLMAVQRAVPIPNGGQAKNACFH